MKEARGQAKPDFLLLQQAGRHFIVPASWRGWGWGWGRLDPIQRPSSTRYSRYSRLNRSFCPPSKHEVSLRQTLSACSNNSCFTNLARAAAVTRKLFGETGVKGGWASHQSPPSLPSPLPPPLGIENRGPKENGGSLRLGLA